MLYGDGIRIAYLHAIVVWGARTWAVCGRNRYIFGFFGTVGLAVMILDIVSDLIAGVL